MGVFKWLADIQRGFEEDWQYEEQLQLDLVIKRSFETALSTAEFHLAVTLEDEAKPSLNIIQAMRKDLRELPLEAWKKRWYRPQPEESPHVGNNGTG